MVKKIGLDLAIMNCGFCIYENNEYKHFTYENKGKYDSYLEKVFSSFENIKSILQNEISPEVKLYTERFKTV